MEPQTEKKRKRAAQPVKGQRKTAKRAKTEISPEEKPTRKHVGKAKALPFAKVRHLISPLIYVEEECRHMALDFDEREEIEAAYDLINFQGWFNLVPEATNANADQVRDFYTSLLAVPPK